MNTLKSTVNKARGSVDTDRRYLLAESVTSSRPPSILTQIDGGGDATPRAASPAISTQSQSKATTYKGFASEAAYLDALKSWAENRRFTDPTETTLVGYYGTTTMAEYASRPAALQPLGLRKKWKAMRANKQDGGENKDQGRRATVA